MVNTGQALGVGLMKAFFRALYFEARRTHRPIVYMAHPEDVYPWRKTPERPVFRWTDLLRSSSHGFRMRRALYETDPAKVARLSQALVDCMRSFIAVRFLTVPQYVDELEEAGSGAATGVWTAPGRID